MEMNKFKENQFEVLIDKKYKKYLKRPWIRQKDKKKIKINPVKIENNND